MPVIKSPIKTEVQGSENFWVGEQTYPCAGRVAHPNFMGTEAPAQRPFWTSPCGPLHLAVYLYPLSYSLLYSKLVNVNVSLSSVSCSSKWLNSRRKFGAFCLITGCSEAQVIDNLDLQLVSGVGRAVVWEGALTLWPGADSAVSVRIAWWRKPTGLASGVCECENKGGTVSFS